MIPHVPRIAGQDDIIPLSRPITTESGEMISEIVVPKGTRIVASIAAYNRSAVLLMYHITYQGRCLAGIQNYGAMMHTSSTLIDGWTVWQVPKKRSP